MGIVAIDPVIVKRRADPRWFFYWEAPPHHRAVVLMPLV